MALVARSSKTLGLGPEKTVLLVHFPVASSRVNIEMATESGLGLKVHATNRLTGSLSNLPLPSVLKVTDLRISQRRC